jgi:hypothetical protein
MDPNLESKLNNRRTHRLVGGIILILFGLTALLARWLDISTYMTLLIGLAMLVWGSLTRRTGWIIPGGVLSGIGLGILSIEGPWNIVGSDQNGVFLACFALGWFLIFVLSAIFTCPQWWALIPGGIMAAVGGTLLVTDGGIRPEDINLIFAALLILLGLGLLLYRGRPRKND